MNRTPDWVAAQRAQGVVGAKVKDAAPRELSVGELLVRRARWILEKDAPVAELAELGQAIALLDCAKRLGTL